MADQNLLARVKEWLKPAHMKDGQTLYGDPTRRGMAETDLAPRNSIFHPFAKQNAALQSLQQGFGTLTDLMGDIRENMQRQGERQDQLLEQLTKLPVLLEQLPESARVQTETLKALHSELAAQHGNQQRLTEILDHVSKSSAAQHEALDGLSERMDRSRQTDERIADNLGTVGNTMAEMGRSSHASANLLENLRDNMSARDNDLQQVLHKQGTRFTVLLSIAIFLSIAALVAVAVIGYLLLMKQK